MRARSGTPTWAFDERVLVGGTPVAGSGYVLDVGSWTRMCAQHTDCRPGESPGFEAESMGRHFRHLRELERTRDEASRTLAQIAEESGRDSILYRRCRELWRRREEEAHASIFHGDFENARV